MVPLQCGVMGKEEIDQGERMRMSVEEGCVKDEMVESAGECCVDLVLCGDLRSRFS